MEPLNASSSLSSLLGSHWAERLLPTLPYSPAPSPGGPVQRSQHKSRHGRYQAAMDHQGRCCSPLPDWSELPRALGGTQLPHCVSQHLSGQDDLFHHSHSERLSNIGESPSQYLLMQPSFAFCICAYLIPRVTHMRSDILLCGTAVTFSPTFTPRWQREKMLKHSQGALKQDTSLVWTNGHHFVPLFYCH
jgi:hypothetical protein